MRHRTRRIEVLLMFLLAVFWWSGETTQTFAAPNDALRGEYNFTMSRSCKIVSTAAAFDIAVNGLATYNPTAGTVAFSNTRATVVTPADVNVGDQTCTGTYAVNADGTFTQTMNCNVTFTEGPLTGNTATLNGIDLAGQITLDGTVILLRNAIPNIETFTPVSPPGAAQDRICGASGLATSRR